MSIYDFVVEFRELFGSGDEKFFLIYVFYLCVYIEVLFIKDLKDGVYKFIKWCIVCLFDYFCICFFCIIFVY